MQVHSEYDLGMDEERDGIPQQAFLVLDDGRSYPLVQAVINIGRMLDNHLVIDDPRVSRHHAQLRVVQGHFVLFDRNSTGGIFVNGHRITETILYPHDTISLGGVFLTYQQDVPLPRPDLADTIR